MGKLIMSPKVLDKLNDIDSDLGNPTSASGVTGADAFSKINTLGNQISHFYVYPTTITSISDLADVVKTYKTGDNIHANVSADVISALSHTSGQETGIIDVYKASSSNAYYHVFNRYVMAYGNLGLSSATATAIYDINYTLGNRELYTIITKTYSNASVTSPGKSGFYVSGTNLAVPTGYVPVSAVWEDDFITGVYPIIYHGNSTWKIALNASQSVTGVNGTVRITCIKTTFGNI